MKMLVQWLNNSINNYNCIRNKLRLNNSKLWPFSIFSPPRWIHVCSLVMAGLISHVCSVLSTSAENCTLRALNSQLSHTRPWALLKPLELLFCVMLGDGFQRARWMMPLLTPIPRWGGNPLLSGQNHFPYTIRYVCWKGTVRIRLAGALDDPRYPFTNSQILKPQSFCFYLTALTFSFLPGNSAQLWWTGLQTYPNK